MTEKLPSIDQFYKELPSVDDLITEEKLPSVDEFIEPPRPEEEIADDWFESDTYASRHESSPEFEKDAEEIVTMHEKAYRMARSKYNPFAVGGSENIHDFD